MRMDVSCRRVGLGSTAQLALAWQQVFSCALKYGDCSSREEKPAIKNLCSSSQCPGQVCEKNGNNFDKCTVGDTCWFVFC